MSEIDLPRLYCTTFYVTHTHTRIHKRTNKRTHSYLSLTSSPPLVQIILYLYLYLDHIESRYSLEVDNKKKDLLCAATQQAHKRQRATCSASSVLSCPAARYLLVLVEPRTDAHGASNNRIVAHQRKGKDPTTPAVFVKTARATVDRGNEAETKRVVRAKWNLRHCHHQTQFEFSSLRRLVEHTPDENEQITRFLYLHYTGFLPPLPPNTQPPYRRSLARSPYSYSIPSPAYLFCSP